MNKYLIKAQYSAGSWARMIARQDDRAAAMSSLLESRGGSLEANYWDVESTAAYTLADLPDAITLAAIVTCMAKTGAFTAVEVHELLTQEQLSDALVLAVDASAVYKVPGYAAMGADLWVDSVTAVVWTPRLDQASFKCSRDGIGARGHPKLSVDRSQMGLNRVGRDVESCGDLLIAAGRQEPENVQFCFSERLDETVARLGRTCAPPAIADGYRGFTQLPDVRVRPHLR